jgi:AcrR family transcriptional regulator
VSQPYLFQLFGTKKELFIAAVRRSFERTVATFRTAAAEAGDRRRPEDVLMAMGAAYANLLEQTARSCSCRCRLYAACEDLEVREAVREEFLRLVRFVQSASGAPDEAVRPWLAEGMLMNVVGRHGPHRSTPTGPACAPAPRFVLDKFAKFHGLTPSRKGGGA